MSQSDFMVLPVLDLMNGKVVRGVAGKRSQYLPIASAAQPGEVLQWLVTRFGPFGDLYAADLDALQGRGVQYPVWQELLRDLPAIRMWLDAGIANGAVAQRLIDNLAPPATARLTIIVALETLTSWQDLATIASVTGPERLAFSLDLIAGRVRGGSGKTASESPLEMVQRIAAVGIHRVIVLDVASVGIRQGVSTLEVCRQIHAALPGIQLFTGGGVRTVEDLVQIQNSGCRGALIATALHDGTIERSDLDLFLKKGPASPH